MKIILASASPRRKKLLSFLIDDFKVLPSRVEEEKLGDLARTPDEMVVKLAQAKAKKVASNIQDPTIVLGADLTVVLEAGDQWQSLGKPKNIGQAREMLKKLRGKSHKVLTGICLFNTGTTEAIADYEVSEVVFNDFSNEALERYLKEHQPLDCAGAYRIQELEEDILNNFQGSFTNIVGLPLGKLAALLSILGEKVKSNWQEKVKEEFGYDE